MSHLSYVGVLVCIVMGSGWLEFFLRTHVLHRGWRFLLCIIPGLVLFICWDAYAIAQGHWFFDLQRLLGWEVIAGAPIDEVLFFIVVPLASVLTLEAVRSVRGWSVGDEGDS